MSDNGQTDISTKDLDEQTKFDMLLDVLTELNTQVSELVEVQKELVEKINDLSLPGADYGIFDAN